MFSELLKFWSCQHIIYYRKWKRQKNLLSWHKHDPWIRQPIYSLHLCLPQTKLLAEFILTLAAFYHPPTKLTWFIRYHIDVSQCVQSGLSFVKLVELVMLIDVFKSIGYPDNFIKNCFKMFLDNKHRIQEKVTTVLKKPLPLNLPYLGPLSLQTKTKLRKSLRGILNCCKLHIVFKSQNKISKRFSC